MEKVKGSKQFPNALYIFLRSTNSLLTKQSTCRLNGVGPSVFLSVCEPRSAKRTCVCWGHSLLGWLKTAALQTCFMTTDSYCYPAVQIVQLIQLDPTALPYTRPASNSTAALPLSDTCVKHAHTRRHSGTNTRTHISCRFTTGLQTPTFH